MPTYIRMPQKGLTEESALLIKWHVKKGDHVKPGDVLFSIETGKATFDVEAEAEGVVLDILAKEGEEVPIKKIIGVIGTPEERNTLSYSPSGTENTAPEKIRISPRARRLAKKMGVPFETLQGTGPGGRIVEEDVKAALAGLAVSASIRGEEKTQKEDRPPSSPQDLGAYSVHTMTGIREVTASTMMRSVQSMAQFTITMSFDASELLSFRDRYNSSISEAVRLSLNDCILYAVSRVLPRYPYVNAHVVDKEIHQFESAHLGIAVDTPRGIFVPTLRYAERKSLKTLSSEAKTIRQKCLEGRLSPDELTGATFTITNVGALGVELFTPIINPPQVAILGIGTIEYKRKKSDAGFTDYPAIPLCLTVDHRAVDGAPAARFLQALKSSLEEFTLLLAQ